MKESTIQQQIISYLSHVAVRHDIVYFSIPNEGIMMAAKIAKMPAKNMAILSTHLKKMGMLSGVPDLCLLYKGNTYFFEVKNETGQVSQIQELIHKALDRAGFTTYIVRSLEDFQSVLNDIIGGSEK